MGWRENLETTVGLCLCAAMCIQRLSMALGSILYVLSMLLFLYAVFKRKSENVLLVPHEAQVYCKLYGLLVLSMIPSVLFSVDISVSVKSFFEMWIYRVFPFVILVFFIRSKRLLETVLVIFLSVMAVDCIVALAQVLLHLADRGWGFGNNKLNLAGILGSVIPVAMVMALDERIAQRLKKAALCVLPFLFIGAFAGKSRGLWVTLVAVLPFVLWRYIRHNRKYMALTAALIIAVGAFFVSSPTYMERAKSITNVTTDISNVDRLIVWKSGYLMFKDHLWTGVGLGNFRREYNRQYVLPEVTQQMPHSHNNFVQIASEAGLFGVAGWTLLTVYILFTNFITWYKRNDPYALMLFAAWMGFTLFGMIDLIIDASSITKILWFLTGSILMLRRGKET